MYSTGFAVEPDFVREEVRDYYGKNGNESVAPVQIMKMMLYLYFLFL